MFLWKTVFVLAILLVSVSPQDTQQTSPDNTVSSSGSGQVQQPASPDNTASSSGSGQVQQPASPGNTASSSGSGQVQQPASPDNSASSPGSGQVQQPASPDNTASSPGSGQVQQPASPDNTASSPGSGQVQQPASPDNTASSSGSGQVQQPASPDNTASSSGSDTTEASVSSEASTSSEESSSSEVLSTSTEAVSTATTNALPSNPRINQICTGNPGMNDRIRTKALEMTNYRRSRLARGFVSKFNGRRLPMAADMIKLKYNCSLETTAKAAVDSCMTSYSNIPYGVQQNIYSISKNRAHYRVDAITEAIKEWWRQVKRGDAIGMKVTYRTKHEGSPISWFTRMAWAKTKTIGCAVSLNCGSTWYVACHYYPGGNIADDVVYMKGYPCTACPLGYFCTTGLLCGAATDF